MKRFRTRIAEIDITYRCNLKCNGCTRRCDLIEPGPDMDPAYLKEQLDESKRIGHRFKQLCMMGGEPTLHRKIDQFLRIVKEYGCKCVIVSNCHSKRTNKVLHDIEISYPEMEIRRSRKDVPTLLSSLPEEYWAMNVAPIDFPEFDGFNFSDGCNQQFRCGLHLTPVGWFPCAVNGASYRVFGFRGHALDDVIHNPQLARLCRTCGRLRRSFYLRRNSRKEPLMAFDTDEQAMMFDESLEEYPVCTGERLLSKTYREALHGR
jgi:hypothetical protein